MMIILKKDYNDRTKTSLELQLDIPLRSHPMLIDLWVIPCFPQEATPHSSFLELAFPPKHSGDIGQLANTCDCPLAQRGVR